MWPMKEGEYCTLASSLQGPTYTFLLTDVCSSFIPHLRPIVQAIWRVYSAELAKVSGRISGAVVVTGGSVDASLERATQRITA